MIAKVHPVYNSNKPIWIWAWHSSAPACSKWLFYNKTTNFGKFFKNIINQLCYSVCVKDAIIQFWRFISISFVTFFIFCTNVYYITEQWLIHCIPPHPWFCVGGHRWTSCVRWGPLRHSFLFLGSPEHVPQIVDRTEGVIFKSQCVTTVKGQYLTDSSWSISNHVPHRQANFGQALGCRLKKSILKLTQSSLVGAELSKMWVESSNTIYYIAEPLLIFFTA